MTVYVDDEQITFGRMKMNHMIADTDEELHEMADLIGVQRKWHQKAGTPTSHYDICLSKSALAIKHGAKLIDREQLRDIINRKKATRNQ